MGAVRAALLTLIAAACLTAGAIAVAQEPPPGEPPDRRPMDDNPCLTERAKTLLCPDLVMRRPYGLYTERLTKPGHTVLRAGNVIDSVGKGPAELHGTRIGPRFMKGRQRIYKRGGGQDRDHHRRAPPVQVRPPAALLVEVLRRRPLRAVAARRGGPPHAADPHGPEGRLLPARPGPDQAGHAAARRPARSTRPAARTRPPQRVTLGTSVGWADIYPPAYPEQWIDVTGLRGCFAYAHIADPENGIYESDEDNNEAQVIVRLPFEQGNARRGCKGRDRGRPYGPRTPY